MPTSRNTQRGKAFLFRVDQKRIGVSLNRRVKIELAKTNLQVDYDEGLWIVSLPFADAVGSSMDYREAKLKLFEYIDVLWSEYVSCPEDELGETGRMQRDLLQEIFKVC
jgi:hypothetical protein